ncbi:MAG TPA: TolC family protein [Vicinamibacterales bacterium]|nr:TolC family protein [Vicinamibacterales bacterium]
MVMACRDKRVRRVAVVCGGLLSMAAAATAQNLRFPQPSVPGALTLAEAERLLIERNVAVAATRYQLSAAQASRLIAGYKPNPTLQLGAEQFPITSDQPSVPRFFTTDSNAGAQPTYTVQVSKTFERGQKREFRIAQAEATVEAAEFLVRDTIRQQLFQLRQAFGAAMLARENLRLAQQIDTQYQRSEQLTVVKAREGELPPVELYRIRAGRLPYQQAVIDATVTYQQAVRDILNVLNLSESDVNDQAIAATVAQVSPATPQTERPPLLVSGDFLDRPLTKSLDDLTRQSLELRPDVQLAKRNLLAAERGVDLAKAQRSRDITASVEYQRVGSDNAVGVLTGVPLFVYNNQLAGIQQAEAQRNAAEALLHQAERQAATDVAKAYAGYLAARQSTTLYSGDNLVQVQKVQDITTFSFQQGSASLFELLEIQRNTQQAFVAYNQTRANYQLSLWQLEQAVGGSIF